VNECPTRHTLNHDPDACRECLAYRRGRRDESLLISEELTEKEITMMRLLKWIVGASIFFGAVALGSEIFNIVTGNDGGVVREVAEHSFIATSLLGLCVLWAQVHRKFQ
jgi:hypothetical protein